MKREGVLRLVPRQYSEDATRRLAFALFQFRSQNNIPGTADCDWFMVEAARDYTVGQWFSLTTGLEKSELAARFSRIRLKQGITGSPRQDWLLAQEALRLIY